MLANTPIWPASGGETDLGIAFAGHLAAHRENPALTLYVPEFVWLDALRDRALRTSDARLTALTNTMLGLLVNPTAHPDFQAEFMTAYEEARCYAYPLTRALVDEHHRLERVMDRLQVEQPF